MGGQGRNERGAYNPGGVAPTLPASANRSPATGTILEGITRASIMEMAGKIGHAVEERRFGIEEWREGVASGEITEVFACGTAAVVTPVGELKTPEGPVPAPASTDLTMRLREELVGLQFGRVEDSFGWLHRVV